MLIKRVFLVLIALLVSGVAFAAGGAHAQEEQFDADATLEVSSILSPELVSGPNHRVQQRVANDGFLNIYLIDSPFGQLRAVSTTQLLQYVDELNAVARMEQLSNSKEFKSGLKGKAADVVKGAKNLVLHPVDTVTGSVSGVFSVFGRVGESLTSRSISDTEDSRLEGAIGFSKTKRDYAYEFKVDVYSRDQILQDRLNNLSWAQYSGSLSMSALLMMIPGGAGVAVSVTGGNELMNKVYRDTPPNELRKRSRANLEAMGVSSAVIDPYIRNRVFTPREQNDIVETLVAMPNTADRAEFIKFAVLTENPDIAYFRWRQAGMYLNFNRIISPLVRFVAFGITTAALTQDGTLVFCAPLDYFRWTPNTSDFATRVNSLAGTIPGVHAKYLWVDGSVSPLARKNLGQMGWNVFEGGMKKLTAVR
ncbi:MAG TPA: hypothetical protein VMJ66_05060 [Geobacteraceae bacterium]|nr:hypothetical protein [Geobacteraceae bacterium]